MFLSKNLKFNDVFSLIAHVFKKKIKNHHISFLIIRITRIVHEKICNYMFDFCFFNFAHFRRISFR